MSPQHARQVSRREFLGGLTLMGTAGLLGLHSRPSAAEPPPETTRIRLVQIPSICQAPQYVAEELLRAEGFTDVQYIKKGGARGITELIHTLVRRGGGIGLFTGCAAGDTGAAVVLRVDG